LRPFFASIFSSEGFIPTFDRTQTRFLVLGLNHTTAPVDVREKLYISEGAIPEILGELRSHGIPEVVALSTCNRTEFYVSGSDVQKTTRALISKVISYFKVDEAWLTKFTYLFSEEEAYRHLFHVASGLDSMVIGEPEILGQLKDAYHISREAGAIDSFFERAFSRAFQTAKRVRTETRIGYNPVSISSMAVEMAKKIFGDLEQKRILVVGAGEMCEVALKHFRKEGLGDVIITNRTYQKARQLAEEVIGTAYPFDELSDLLLHTDLVLSSTGADKPFITQTMITSAMKKRKNKPLFLIDIAVPRDVEPEVNNLENVYLYDIDDLKGLSRTHLSNRLQEADRAQAIIEEEIVKFATWRRQQDINPFIAQITDNLERMRNAELKKTMQRLGEVDDQITRQMNLLTKSIVNKIIHSHLSLIKKNDSPIVLEVMKSLFDFEEERETEVDPGDEGK
jgi:glutamyl-tRNA reductase